MWTIEEDRHGGGETATTPAAVHLVAPHVGKLIMEQFVQDELGITNACDRLPLSANR